MPLQFLQKKNRVHKTHVYLLAFMSVMLWHNVSLAQPNNNCTGALNIAIPNNGFGLGTFSSTTVNASASNTEPGETFPPQVTNDDKSVWFKFTIPTTRRVNICLIQTVSNGNNYNNFCGISIYNDNGTCPPLQNQVPFGVSAQNQASCIIHTCFPAGTYLIQASLNSALPVNPPVQFRIDLTLADPTAANSNYDVGALASNFGTLSGLATSFTGFTTGCQGISEQAEICPNLPNGGANHLQSTWHTFTTDSYVDYVGAYLKSINTSNTPIGYRLFEGDVHSTPFSGLTPIGTCQQIVYTGGNLPQIENFCNLQANTTYSIQLLFPQSYGDSIQLTLYQLGNGPTLSPVPATGLLHASTNLGTINPTMAGNTFNIADNFGCNGRLSLPANQCPPANPANGVTYGGHTYDIVSWYTFTNPAYANVTISATMPPPANSGCLPVYIRLYNQAITASCGSITGPPMLSFANSSALNCLPPGIYSFQVMGCSGINNVIDPCNSQFGRPVNVSVTSTQVVAGNLFDLENAAAYNGINNMAPLNYGTNYVSTADHFDCDSTLRPGGTLCQTDITKSSFRQFNIANDGILYVSNLNPGTIGSPVFDYRLYSGNAATASVGQSVNNWPQTLNLAAASNCISAGNHDYQTSNTNRFCVTSGDYTFVTLGNYNDIGINDQPAFTLQNITTVHNSPANAENMGVLSLTVPNTSSIDHFSCTDNVNNGPCGPAYTKAIYRQFCLPASASITITTALPDSNFAMALFYGSATTIAADSVIPTSPIDTTPWLCTNTISTSGCEILPAGCYTLVCYGKGPSYTNPLYANGEAGNIGRANQIVIDAIAQDNSEPNYNRPYKACKINNNNPLNWYAPQRPGFGSVPPQYPYRYRTYFGCTETFTCKTDSFAGHPVIPCADTLANGTVVNANRVAYYTFRINQESFVIIYNLRGTVMSKVYNFDVHIDSVSMLTATPIQPCISDDYFIELCRLQPGVYTLACFANDQMAGQTLLPVVLVDTVNYSRFDHAAGAYDFGLLPDTSVYIGGKPGDVNPLHPLRAPSHDFFYCTTGAHATDPADLCYTYDAGVINNRIYPPDTSKPLFLQDDVYGEPRRNLWYTFALAGKGRCDIKVVNPNPFANTYRYSVYKSNVNGSIPFSTLATTGPIDSTLNSGLILVASNKGFCDYAEETSFELCNSQTDTGRYYIVVDKYAYYYFDSLAYTGPYVWPNQQVEVYIKFDSILVRYDHCTEANVIGSGQIDGPYPPTDLNIGTHYGAPGNLICETRDPGDLGACGNTTIWYKFSTTQTGRIRVGFFVDSDSTIVYNADDLILLHATNNGNPSCAQTTQVQLTGTSSGLNTYGEDCLIPGTYYIMLTGCNYTYQNLTPFVQIFQDAGDFCANPVSTTLTNQGSTTLTATVNCHTMGGDFGEDGSNVVCMADPQGFKSSWFRIDITDTTQKYDLTFSLTANLTPPSQLVPYRVLGGDCSAMILDPSACGAINTGFSVTCKTAGSYYVQVFTPAISLGSVSLNVQSTITTDPNCNPITANFLYTTACNTDSVYFSNLSLQGTHYVYDWDFGFGSPIQHELNPVIVFPNTPTAQTYNVRLTVTDTMFNATNDTVLQVSIYPDAHNALGNDTSLCAGQILGLQPQGYVQGQYIWQNGSNAASYTVSSTGQYWVIFQTDSNYCSDTINVTFYPLPVAPFGADTLRACQNDTVILDAGNPGSVYSWSPFYSNQVNYITTGGLYSVTITNQYSCSASDSSLIIINPLPTADAGSNVSICRYDSTTLNATGGNAYAWSNGSATSSIVVSPATNELYYVTVTDGNNCSAADSVLVSVRQIAYHTIYVERCEGQNYLAGGAYQTNSGSYVDTLTAANGCDSVLTTVLTVYITPHQFEEDSICEGQAYTLPAGSIVTVAGIYTDTVTRQIGTIYCDSVITITLSVLPLPTPFAGNDTTICLYDTITLVASGGISYLWSNNTSTASNRVSPSAFETYTVTVSDGFCTAADNVNVGVWQLPTVAILSDTFFCYGDSLPLTVIGNGTFVWSTGETSSTIYVNQPGQYAVTVTDSNTCSNTTSDTAGYFPLLNISYNVQQPLCFGNSNGRLNALVDGGDLSLGNPYLFQWADSMHNNIGATNPLTQLAAGLYHVTVTDNQGCIKADSVLMGQPDSLQITFLTSKDISCFGYNNGSINIGSTGGTLPLYYSIDGGTTYQTATQFLNLPPGVFNPIILDSNNCQTDYWVPVTIHEPGPIAVNITASRYDTLKFGETINLFSNYNDMVAPPVIGNWSPDASLDCSTCPNVTGMPLITTTYMLAIEDSNGCFANDTITVKVNPGDKTFFAPNAFTPNNDGNNDVFKIYALGVYFFDCQIFDRWGEKIFDWQNINEGWDGIYKGKPMPPGVYVYQVHLNYLDGVSQSAKGSVTLIK